MNCGVKMNLLMMATPAFRAALALAFSRPRPAIHMAAASDSFPKLADELPFLQSPELLADDIIYRGFGAQYKGRQAYAAAAAAWKRELTRRELEEVKRLAGSGDDELRAIAGGDLTNEEFERWFALFVARNFLIGGAIGAVAVAALRLAVGALQQ